jgi:hypothetical protein
MNLNQISRLGRTRVASDCAFIATTLRRPANVIPYTAGDCVGVGNGVGTVSVLTSISNANPGVATLAAHGLTDGTCLQLTTTGVLPAGLALATNYFVVSATADTFSFAATSGGAAIATTNAGSGTHTVSVVGSAIWEFPSLVAGLDVVTLREATLRIDVAAVPSGMSSFRLHLYNATPPSAYLDNDAWDLPAGDRAAYLGFVDIGSPVDLGSTLWAQTSGINKDVAALSGSLFCYLVTTGGYTPTSGAVKTLQLSSISI